MIDKNHLIYLLLLYSLISGCSQSSPPQSVPSPPPLLPSPPPLLPSPPPLLPSPPPSSPICNHEGIIQILAKLSLNSVNGCNLNQLLSDTSAAEIDIPALLTLIRKAETKKNILFNIDAETIDDHQWNNHKDELLSNLTTMFEYPDNTIAFMIFKTFTKGNMIKNREMSNNRATHMQSRIDELLKSEGGTLRCSQFYRIEYLDHDENLVKRCSRDPGYPSKTTPIIILTYPCFREMCEYMKEGLNLSCEKIPEECKEINHCNLIRKHTK